MRNNAWKIGTSSLALISCFPILLLSLFHRKNNWRRINYQNRIFSCWQRCTTLTYTAVEEGSCMSKGIESLRRDLISIWKKVFRSTASTFQRMWSNIIFHENDGRSLHAKITFRVCRVFWHNLQCLTNRSKFVTDFFTHIFFHSR